MKRSTVVRIINMCPDIELFKRALTKYQIDRIKTHFLTAEEVKSGENSFDVKEELVKKYRDSKVGRNSETEKILRHVLNDSPKYKDVEDKSRIETDMIFCRLAYGFQPDEYLCFDLDKQSMEERQQWVSDLDRFIYIHSMNDIKRANIFNNKARTYEKFGSYFVRDAIGIKTEKDFGKFRDFVNKHPVFVKKIVTEGCGRSIELMDSASSDPKQLFDELISAGEHIIEEKIEQHEIMSALNRSSVNTVRCFTVLTKHGTVIPYTFLKVGREGSFVDNGGAGGILAGIDVATGKVCTKGYDELLNVYDVHPDNGITFEGFQIPDWDKMKSICMEMAQVVPSVKCVGWDMAYTDKGWALVEGNGKSQFIVPQIVYRRGIKKELLKVLADVDCIFPIK